MASNPENIQNATCQQNIVQSTNSPSEYYDPLLDELDEQFTGDFSGQYNVGSDTDDDSISYTEESGHALGQKYSVTPPSLPRSRIREKERNGAKSRNSDKSYKEFLISKRQQQQPKSMNVIKNEYLSDPALCSLTEFDSDDNLDMDSIKEKREKKKRESKVTKKTLSMIRFNDRQEKRLSEDFSLLTVSDPLEQTPMTVKLNGSGRFEHFRKKPVPISTGSVARQHITEAPVCQKDREEFYNNFSLLISLGTEAKKDKEKKMSSAKRQISVELYQWQAAMSEQLWIELQAYINGKISPEEQSDILKKERQQHEHVIDEINKFCFTDTLTEESPDSAFSKDSSMSNGFFNNSPKDKSYREKVSRSVSASFYEVNLTNDVVCLQVKALTQVQKLLDRLDHYESCFNATKACEKENKKYMDPEFQRRVKCLNLWLNITCDLCQKLKLFGKIICAHNRGISWPLINFEFPKPQPLEFLANQRASLPNVLETEPTDCSDIDEADDSYGSKTGDKETTGDAAEAQGQLFLSPNRKQVKFQFGDESNSDQGSPSGSPLNYSPSSPSNPLNCSTPLHQGDASSCGQTASYSSVLGSSQSNLEDSQVHNSSLYRHYVEKCLRKMGLQRLNVRLRDLFHRSLHRAKEALQRPKDSSYTDLGAAEKIEDMPEKQEEYSSISSSGPCSTETSTRPELIRGSSLSEHGEWSSQFIEMGLPSFRPTYLYIVRIQLDVIHECLKLRKDQRPIGDPSFLSIRQLIRECKEVLKGATMVKQYYHYMVDAVIWDEQEAEAKLETDLYEFDEDMKSILDVYFNYLQNWIYMLQSLPQASLGMKSALEEEWTFTKSICSFIIGGEATAAKRFSSLASSLLSSIEDFVDKGIDDNTRNLFDEGFDNEENSEESEDEYSDENENIENKSKSQKMARMKSNVQVILRNFKNLFNEARERSSKALGFAKLLRKDLEVAADYDISVTTKELFSKLKETRHVQLCAPLSAGYMMFIPEKILSNNQLVLQLLNVTCGREDKPEKSQTLSKQDTSGSNHSSSSGKEDGYLLMMRCENGQDHLKECPKWTGFKMMVEPTAETAIALSHIEVMGLLFVVTKSSSLAAQRKTFESIMCKTIQLVNEQTSCHQSIAESFSELKTNAVDLMVKLAQNIQQVNEKLNFNEVIQHEENILKLYRETMLKIYDFGFEYQRELMRLISRDHREKMCHMSVNFVLDWMAFVIKRCERGRGTRPRWATQGLEFIALACEPKNIVYLTDQEFQNFQHNIHNSLSHIIGSSENRSVGHGLSLSRSNLDLSRTNQPSMQRLTSCPEPARFIRSVSARSVQSEPSSGQLSSTSNTPLPGSTPFFGDSRGTRYSIPELPEMSVKNSSDGQIYLEFVQARHGSRGLNESSKPRSDRLQICIEKLENDRQEKLREKRIIGHVTTRIQEPDYRINVKRVNFRWQRGIKIGEGQFGKVYTAVNINTGELMAMKEMKFQPNDQQSLKEICDEIKNFEGINHKNLVRYYGVEVHKDEMLMFMEYCDSGSIEEVARIGLPEYMIRRYTHEIVHAIAHLHENNIVHRDIKGANIFLTSQGHVKLGDFGCSVKLKSQQTMPGENINLVGTTAYMAPEVITQNKQEGYGRAADIWSLGCVVIEMATGKRPWHELEHNLQVMFKVGMGHTPPIPEGLSKEGKNFLSLCLVHEPSQRATAAQLLDHIFVKYECEVEENDSDDD
ncbi:mitogen-activated protein kinase kinase kinase 4 isoform X1 [Biomphalaria pfeifferi]|uniref:Mitogen-activated protein kinase kinase kinase 4 n=1 Tax=Biomphalaria pfeifferi TaxID=112525 RepID=A0AAD8C222_BIOPF|nr:mitogen-activated protein kinase kinase kinase 4 isoform X1 [Biomphalaria pfeifferi]